MNNMPPLCRYCGKPIGKSTITVYFKETLSEYDNITTSYSRIIAFGDKGRPQTKTEAQRYINGEIVSVRRSREYDSFDDEYKDVGIHSVSVWNGESYKDKFFCNSDHAQSFGYVMARAGHRTKAHQDAESLRHEKENCNERGKEDNTGKD